MFATRCLSLVVLSLAAVVAQAADVTSSGLDLIVPPGEVGGVKWAGGRVAALPGRAQTLVVNLKTRELHVLGRSLGDGDIALAAVTSFGDGILRIEQIPPRLPSTRIPQAVQKLSKGELLNVTTLGTSLVENGRIPQGWMSQLFDKKKPVSRFYVGSDLDEKEPGNIAVKNYALGGSNSRYTAAVLGTAVAGDRNPIPSPAFACDLAIVGLLPNDGIDRLELFESVVRQLRSRGIEVLLLTDNVFAKAGEADPLWKDGEFVRKMADRYGCALADTAAYMREGELRGLSVYKDQIHHASSGEDCWAEAVAGVLSPGVSLEEAQGLEASVSATRSASISEPYKVPSEVLVDFLPNNSGGQFVNGAPDNRLAKMFRTERQGLLQLSVGNSIELSHRDMMAADLIVDGSSGFVAEVKEASTGRLVKAITYAPKVGTGSRAVVRTIFSANELRNTESSPYSITVVEGTMNLYGLSYHLKSKP